ncbi:MAG: chemotaxis protein CheW [Gallionellaceae bacterium]|nr:chemotaxis protein CheW [Gallionellaceae bacterium]
MIPYLLFELDGVRYGVEAGSVLEIAWLPELTPAEEAPPYIAGMVNLRGRIVPVMDLALRLGHPPRRCRLGDSIVLLQQDGTILAMIVSAVTDVVGIPATEIEPPLHFDDLPREHAIFLAGNAKVGDGIIMLLDVTQLIHAPTPPGASPPDEALAYFSPDATAEERQVFHTRAHNLIQAETDLETAERIPLSIIQIGGEYFGVELEVVREFAHLRRVTPVPCCPPHIAGNMNLRGDILTLADIRGLLNIPTGSVAAEVMVVEAGEASIGVPVDQVLEVLYLHPADIAPLPAAAHEEKHEYCKGVTHYGEGMVSLLDMRKILAQGGLEVDEEA